MKVSMALTHAILAILTDRSCSGYDIAKQFDGSVGFFWNASHQQIYRELSKLEKQGLITCEVISQDGKPAKKIYSVNDSGKTALCDWIAQPTHLPPIKDAVLIKLFVGHLVPPDTIFRLLEDQRRQHATLLATYREIEANYFSEPNQLSDSGQFQYLTLRNGIHFETGWLAWCDEAIAYLQKS
jgi:DNA-binding PadR family transcriptional regulator